MINLDEYKSTGTYWVSLYVNVNAATYFDNFRVEHVQEELKPFMSNKNIIVNIYRVKVYDSIT